MLAAFAGLALALSIPAPRAIAPRMCAAAGFVTPEAPPAIETECGFDHVPLSIALQTGDFLEADQITRDSLIKLAGAKAVSRGYVYFSEVPNLPETDLATIERLWLAYSGGKFGYSVQAKEFKTKKVNGNPEKLFARIGWMNDEVRPAIWLAAAAAGLRGCRLCTVMLVHRSSPDASMTSGQATALAA